MPAARHGGFHRETPRTARKQHRCFACSGEIPVGQRHVEIAHFSTEHNFAAVRAHEPCLIAYDPDSEKSE